MRCATYSIRARGLKPDFNFQPRFRTMRAVAHPFVPRSIMLLRKLSSLLPLVLLVPLQWAQPQAVSAPASPAATAVRTGPAFDVKAATDAYLATVPPDKKARSDAYFEGGYWLQFWDFLLSSAIVIFLLHGRLSARMRNWAQRPTSSCRSTRRSAGRYPAPGSAHRSTGRPGSPRRSGPASRPGPCWRSWSPGSPAAACGRSDAAGAGSGGSRTARHCR